MSIRSLRRVLLPSLTLTTTSPVSPKRLKKRTPSDRPGSDSEAPAVVHQGASQNPPGLRFRSPVVSATKIITPTSSQQTDTSAGDNPSALSKTNAQPPQELDAEAQNDAAVSLTLITIPLTTTRAHPRSPPICPQGPAAIDGAGNTVRASAQVRRNRLFSVIPPINTSFYSSSSRSS